MLLFLEPNERDYKILATLLLLRMCTISQIGALYFSCTKTSSKRLRLLRENKYIVSAKTFTSNSNKWFFVYFLTKKGEREARYWLERFYKRIVPNVNLLIHKNLFNHELLMVDVFVKLVLEKQISVEDLFSGKFMDSRLAPVLPCIFKKRRELKPDARFEFNGVNIWVEIDRGTEHTRIIEEKLKSYQMYFASNPGERHTVLFLVDGNAGRDVEMGRIHEIRELSCKYIGPHNNGGKINWFTLEFSDLDFIVKKLIQPTFFNECLKGLIKIGFYKKSMAKKLFVFDHTFLPTANMSAAWLGFKDMDTEYEQFYIVENIIGGQSGALQRLSYFEIQYSEYFNKNQGHKIKLIVLINDPMDLRVIADMYPKVIDKLIYVSVPELLNGQCKALIAREEKN